MAIPLFLKSTSKFRLRAKIGMVKGRQMLPIFSNDTDKLFDLWEMIFSMYTREYHNQIVLFCGPFQSRKSIMADLLPCPLKYKALEVNGNLDSL